jgi:predicted nucleic acid-binding protein
VTSLDESLQGVTKLAIDTAPLIYLIEDHLDFGKPVREVIQRAENGKLDLVTSILSLTEVLVQPLRQARLRSVPHQ